MTTPIAYRTLEELTPSHWRGDTVAANGIDQYYTRTGGDKPPLLLLHGFQMDGLTWMRTAKRLEADYDVIMLDARGHGRTGSATDGYATARMVEDVAAFIRALELDRPCVIGHSMGADVAGRLALEYADLVRGLVLIDPALQRVNPAAWMESEGYRAWYRDWLAYAERLRTQSHAEAIEATLARHTPGMSPTQEEDFVTHIAALRHFDLGVLAHVGAMDEGMAPLLEVLARVEAPKLLLLAQPPAGAYSLGANRAAEREELAGRWRNGEVVIFEETGHFIHSERPEAFDDLVRSFLEKIGRDM